ncbi:MAG: hypothetical protein HY731_05040 [Candidatus Tectomicrobia bacterium]|nr:hypothetical protein [Candidatus Tectomicrobia bacterium]
MYRTLTQHDLFKEFDLTEAEIPHGLIVHGSLNITGNLEIWKGLLRDSKLLRHHNILLGKDGETTIAFAVTYGSPMTSEVVHIAAVLGAKIVVQTGGFGGLQRGMKVGDLLIPTDAFRADGASDWYLPKEEKADASPDVIAWFAEECERRQLNYHLGQQFTTTALMAERWEDIVRWNKEGFSGVDLETATTFAVAKHFGMKRGAILRLLDNLIEGHTLLALTNDERERLRKGNMVLFELALSAVRRFTNDNP